MQGLKIKDMSVIVPKKKVDIEYWIIVCIMR